MSKFDSKYSLYTVHDAVHGSIDFKSFDDINADTIVKLLNTPVVQRLRYIKQLGYASHSHPSADHSRFAHAIGTMHLMRNLIHRVKVNNKDFFCEIVSNIRHIFKGIVKEQHITQHLLLSALLQDIGELPYGQATELFFRPSDGMIDDVRIKLNNSDLDWATKDIFTAYSILNDKDLKEVFNRKINDAFLIYLITGHLNDDNKNVKSEVKSNLATLRQLVDGVVDADRLDYVYRDFHHAFGSMGSPSSVIQTLLSYDNEGPIFSEPGPISEFMIKRALLWKMVYFSPVNRFRITLLKTFLKGVFYNNNFKKRFFEGKEDFSYDSFKALDDISLTNRLIKFHENNVSNGRIKLSLSLLLKQSPEYTAYWLQKSEQINITADSEKKLVLPDDFFYDTFPNYNTFLSFDRTTVAKIRIKNSSFKYISKDPIDINICTGNLIREIESGFSAVPIKDGILIFEPKKNRSNNDPWIKLNKMKKSETTRGILYNNLIYEDFVNSLEYPVNTVKIFEGDIYFISFASEDILMAKKVIKVLFENKIRYNIFLNDFQGLGRSVNRNISDAINKADRFLLLVSENWKKKFNIKDSPINFETEKIIRKVAENYSEKIRIVCVGSKEFQMTDFPVKNLGILFAGRKDLKDLSNEEFNKVIVDMIKEWNE